MRRPSIALVGLLLLMAWGTPARAAGTPTIDKITRQGHFMCGVTDSLYSFAGVDGFGRWTGFDVDFCRAVATAKLGDPDRVRFIPLGTAVRFDALRNGEVDVLFRNTTWTLTRDASAGIDFAGINFYDEQGFLAAKSLGVRSLAELKAPTVCVTKHTTTHDNLLDHVAKNNLKDWTIRAFDTFDVGHKAFFSGGCTLYTTDRSALAAMRAFFPPNPDDFIILDDTIFKEPLGPVVRNDDPAWFDLVKWVVQALIAAEEFGINSRNVETIAATSADPRVRFLLGVEPGIGAPLGLDDGWARRVIATLGNYGEIFDRNLGPKTPMKLERGLNRLWSDGGLLYALPLR